MKPNRSSEYAGYFDTVRTVPTYLLLSYLQIFLSGELRCDLCLCDSVLTFGHCGKRTTLAL